MYVGGNWTRDVAFAGYSIPLAVRNFDGFAGPIDTGCLFHHRCRRGGSSWPVVISGQQLTAYASSC